MILGHQAEIDAIVTNTIAGSPNDFQFLRDMINFYATQGRIPKALEVALLLQKVQPEQWDVPLTISKYQLITGQRAASYASLQRAVQLGGNLALQQVAREQLFQQVAADPAFQQALHPSQPATPSVSPEVSGFTGGASAPIPAPTPHPKKSKKTQQ